MIAICASWSEAQAKFLANFDSAQNADPILEENPSGRVGL